MLSLECFCGEYHNDVHVPGSVPGCSEDGTCSISDTSVGQCYLEIRTFLDTNVVLKYYKCLEIQSTMIDVSLALQDLCNHTSEVVDMKVTDVGCCTHGDFCNRDIVFLEHSTSSSSEAPPGGTPGGNQSPIVLFVCVCIVVVSVTLECSREDCHSIYYMDSPIHL